MLKSKSRKRKSPKRVLALPDLDHTQTAVLNSLTSASGQRTYDHAIREFVRPNLRLNVRHPTGKSAALIKVSADRNSRHVATSH